MSKEIIRRKQRKLDQRKGLARRGSIIFLTVAAAMGWAVVLIVS